MGEQSEPLWSTEELSRRLSIPVGTLRRWRREGRGPAWLKLGGHVRYDPAAVRVWLSEQRGKR
jgi:excisionase family DNA binding protein